MEIVQKELPGSGYQPRPQGPPSAGRALSVLIAVCAVLWVWCMLPQLWPTQVPNPYTASGPTPLLYQDVVVVPVVFLANAAVFWWATRPMWQANQASLAADLKRGFTLILCVLFHVATPVGGFVLLSALALGAD